MPWAIRTTLMISLVALPFLLYVGLRWAASVGTVRPALRRKTRKAVLLLIACLSCFPLLFLMLHLLGHTEILLRVIDTGKGFDYLFFYPLWIGVIVVLELVTPFLLLDIIDLIGGWFRSRRERWRKALAYARIVVGIAVAVYVPIRAAVDTTQVRDDTAYVHLKNLPDELKDLRITLVGDIQVDRFTGGSKVAQVHDIVRQRQPHLLLSSGDIVTSGTNYLTEARAAMSGMKGTLASVSVMGDHDYWSAPGEIRALQVECGWTFLENEHRVLVWNGRRILLTGLTHVYSRRLNEARLDSVLDRAPEADLRILLVHQPAEWLLHRASERGYDLLVAGHTHGGQIVIHPLGIPVTASMRETGYYSGEYTLGSMAIVVTNGVGLTLAPVRYHAPAEVTTIVLGPKSQIEN